MNIAKRWTLATIFFGLLYLVVLYKVYYFAHGPKSLAIEVYSIATGLFLLSRFAITFFYEDEHEESYAASRYPTVSFVIACKNEEDSIYKTIETCLASEYPGKMDLVAIDDGSTDATYSEMIRARSDWPGQVKVVKFEKNKGKREGMAAGIEHSKGDIVVFVDSDSFVEKKAVKLMVGHFLRDSRVGAVSGNTLVENVGVNALTKMQSARYGVSFDVFKAAESVFGTVTCCPGCFSAYRRAAIMPVLDRWLGQMFMGTKSTFGDDRSLTNFVMRTWKVEYCRAAKATTIVPEQYKKFFKQQLRWKKSWVREGAFNTGLFIWKKHPLASISFYINLLIPVFGPLVVLKVFLWDFVLQGKAPVIFLGGVVIMSLLFGIYYYLIYPNRYWFYVVPFTLLYTLVLVWQMPYALLKMRDTRWGTR